MDKEFKYIHEDDAAFKKAVFEMCLSTQAMVMVTMNQTVQILALQKGQDYQELLKQVQVQMDQTYKLLLASCIKTAKEDQELGDIDISDGLK